MKKIEFEGKQYDVIDETETHYVCPPANASEGYQYFMKSTATEIPTQADIDRINNRIVWKCTKHKWSRVAFKELTSGCEFKLFEEDGTPVLNNIGEPIFIAAAAPYVDRFGMNMINVYRQYRR